MTSVVMAVTVTIYGDANSAVYHARIQQCGSWGGIANAITEIVEGCDVRYHKQFYFTVSKDDVSTGNLEMSIEKMDGSGDKVWVHQKNGANEGFPN